MALAAEAEDGDFVSAQTAQVGVAIVMDLHGGVLLGKFAIDTRKNFAGQIRKS